MKERNLVELLIPMEFALGLPNYAIDGTCVMILVVRS